MSGSFNTTNHNGSGDNSTIDNPRRGRQPPYSNDLILPNHPVQPADDRSAALHMGPGPAIPGSRPEAGANVPGTTMGSRPMRSFDSQEIYRPTAFDNVQNTEGANAFNSARPRNVQPTEQGGVAPGGQSDLPMGKANFVDKFIGKTEKVAGKVTNNADLHETGELRETGGAAAARGEARAAHD